MKAETNTKAGTEPKVKIETQVKTETQVKSEPDATFPTVKHEVEDPTAPHDGTRRADPTPPLTFDQKLERLTRCKLDNEANILEALLLIRDLMNESVPRRPRKRNHRVNKRQ